MECTGLAGPIPMHRDRHHQPTRSGRGSPSGGTPIGQIARRSVLERQQSSLPKSPRPAPGPHLYVPLSTRGRSVELAAEQAIRPAVVNRKVFGGNRTEAGAGGREILGSLFATCAQRGYDAMNYLSHMLCFRSEHRSPYIQSLLPLSSG